MTPPITSWILKCLCFAKRLWEKWTKLLKIMQPGRRAHEPALRKHDLQLPDKWQFALLKKSAGGVFSSGGKYSKL